MMEINPDSVFIIAEIGGNHEGDFDKARALLRLAVDSGADSVKFQVYTGDTLVNVNEDPDRVAHFNRFALKNWQYKALADECLDLGVDFSASIWNENQIDLLDDYLSFYKIGSGDLTAYPLLKVIANRKKPIVLSTGLATLAEIEAAVDFLCGVDPVYSDKDMLSILQCTSMYPIPEEDANLRVITALRDRFDYNIGYSDHTVGSYAAEIAIALGARILEVHFTDTREGKVFRDHQVSFTADEVKRLRERASMIIALLGDGNKRPMQSEIDSGHVVSFRRGLYPNRDILAGEVVREEDLVALRPRHGISASDLQQVIGKTAKHDINRLAAIERDDFSE